MKNTKRCLLITKKMTLPKLLLQITEMMSLSLLVDYSSKAIGIFLQIENNEELQQF